MSTRSNIGIMKTYGEIEEFERVDKSTHVYKKVMVMTTDWICIGELEKDQSLEEFLKKEYRRQLKLENPDEKNYELWTKYYREIIYDYGKIPESFIQLDDMWYTDINIFRFAKEDLDKLSELEKMQIMMYLKISLKEYEVARLEKRLLNADDIERVKIRRKLNNLLDRDNLEDYEH